MAKTRKRTAHRPKGSRKMTQDVAACPWVYQGPLLLSGAWRVRRRARLDGKQSTVTLFPEVEMVDGLERKATWNDAYQAVTERAHKEAQQAEQAALPAHQREPVTITMGEASERFLKILESDEGYRARTIKNMKHDFNAIFAYLPREKLVRDVTYTDLVGIRTAMATPVEEAIPGRRVKAGLSARYRIKISRLLKHFFRDAKKHGYCNVDPAAELEIPKALSREERADVRDVATYLTVDQARELVRAAGEKFVYDTAPRKFHETREEVKLPEKKPPVYLKLAIQLSLLTGLRRGNLTGDSAIRWGDVDVDEPGKEMIRIDGDRMKNATDLVLPLSLQVGEILRTYRRTLPHIPKATDRIVTGIDLKGPWERLLRRMKLKLRFHDLRHTFATWTSVFAGSNVTSFLLHHAQLGDKSKPMTESDLMSSNSASTPRYLKGMTGSDEGIAVLRAALDKLPRLDAVGEAGHVVEESAQRGAI